MGSLSDPDLQYVAREVKARCGLALTPDKAHTIEMRLSPIARREGFLSVQELITTARARRDERLLWTIADTLIVSETSFFRDRATFNALRDDILPELARAGARPRILSAGCSSGQEPYSLAMMLEDMRQTGAGIPCDIVALDISDRAVEKARAGLYSQFEVQRGLPVQMLIRHFEKSAEMWRISDRVRAAVKLQKANLLNDLSAYGQFDLILCRNTLAYFDNETRTATLGRLAAILAPQGRLVLGQTETAGHAALAPVTGVRGVYMHSLAAQHAA